MKLEIVEPGDAVVWIRLEGRLDLKGVEEVLRVAGIDHVAAIVSIEDEARQAFLDGCALSRRTPNAVEVAAEEVLSNVWKYAWAEWEPAEASLALDTDGPVVVLEVADEGLPFDPTLVPLPPPPSVDGAPGGRGIHLVRGLSSTFGYRREGSRNVVTVGFRAA